MDFMGLFLVVPVLVFLDHRNRVVKQKPAGRAAGMAFRSPLRRDQRRYGSRRFRPGNALKSRLPVGVLRPLKHTLEPSQRDFTADETFRVGGSRDKESIRKLAHFTDGTSNTLLASEVLNRKVDTFPPGRTWDTRRLWSG